MATTQAKLGKDAKLYYNSGTYAVPVWNEISNATDVTINVAKGEADVTRRGSGGWKEMIGTLKEGSITFEMIHIPHSTGYSTLQKAFDKGTTVEIAAMDGAVTSTSQGYRMTVSVTDFSLTQPLTEAQKTSVTLKPTTSDNAPYLYEVGVCDSGEPTTSAGANVYWDSSTEEVTFTASSNTFYGVSVADYTSGGTLIFFNGGADEV